MRCHFEFSPQTLSELMRPVKCLSYLSVQNNSNQAGIAAVFVTLLRLETEKKQQQQQQQQTNKRMTNIKPISLRSSVAAPGL